MKEGSLFFDDLLDTKVREFKPRYAGTKVALLEQFLYLHTDRCRIREIVAGSADGLQLAD